MPTYTQADRPLSLTTPLGADRLLLVGIEGREALSELFRFEFELLAVNGAEVPFDRLLGQKVSAKIRIEGVERYISGIVSCVGEGHRDDTFTSYRIEVVPQVWLLTRKSQSRIFQGLSVPDILKQVLTGLEVSYETQGTFEPRDYCVQYRETDFAFAARLMEEEGIYYFFEHTAAGSTLVLANTPQSHPDAAPATAIYEEIEGGNRPEERIFAWRKSQNLRSGKTTLWDFNFELPGKNLEATKTIVETIQAGTVTHKMKVANNDALELYDYPGGYANRFDGVDPGGGDRATDLQKIFEDKERTVDIRMEQEAVGGLLIRAQSTCAHLIAGYRFDLERHFNANGAYVVTAVNHRATLQGDYRTGGETEFRYENALTCIPFALPFRPQRVTPIPRVHGTQTAVVVGSSDEEIFTDKYGRVKVQFPWDREGQKNATSSCWLRVATPWAGKQWGMIHIPRVGQEVLVDFVDGDVDQPVIVGSLYNSEQMPPYVLPDNKTQSGIKSRSSRRGDATNYNEIRFEDKAGSEQVLIHAEKDQTIEVENDESHWVGHDRTKKVDHDENVTIGNDRTEKVSHNESIEIGNDRTTKVGANETVTITSNRDVTISNGNDTLTIQMGNSKTSITVGKSETEAMQSIELKVGSSSVKLDQTGVTIKGMNIQVEGQVNVSVKGVMTQVNADAVLTLKGGVTMIN